MFVQALYYLMSSFLKIFIVLIVILISNNEKSKLFKYNYYVEYSLFVIVQLLLKSIFTYLISNVISKPDFFRLVPCFINLNCLLLHDHKAF